MAGWVELVKSVQQPREKKMKWIKQTCSVFLLCVITASTQAEPVIEKPALPPEVMLSVTVSDLHGFIDEVGAVAAQVSPMINGAMIKNMVGTQLGDPGLAGIGPGKGLSIVALDPTNIFAVVEIEEALSANYVNLAKNTGNQAKYENGILVVSDTPEALAKGFGMVGVVKESLLGSRSPTLRISLQPAAILERNKAAIDGFMPMLSGLMTQGMMQQPGATPESAQCTAKILEGELQVALSLASQCEVVGIVLAPKGGSIRINKTLIPKPGTGLAKVMNAPKLHKENAKIHSGVLEQGTMAYDFHISNSEALAEFVAVEVEKLVKAMNIEDVDSAALIASMKKMFKIYGGTGCEQVTFGAEGKMEITFIMEIQDEAAALEMLKSMEKDMAPIFKMYEALGMPMSFSFKENAREIDGVKVHEFIMNMKLESMPPEQQEQMKVMGLDNMVYDVAISDGMMYYSGAGGMDALMKRVKDPAMKAEPIKARSVYPAGGFYYFDLDMGSYAAFVARMLPESPEATTMTQQMGTLFKGVDPVTSAGFRADNCVMWSVNIPGELIAKLGQMAMMMQMQKMQRQQQMGAPGGTPPAVTAP
jgi:hypothetical protein